MESLQDLSTVRPTSVQRKLSCFSFPPPHPRKKKMQVQAGPSIVAAAQPKQLVGPPLTFQISQVGSEPRPKCPAGGGHTLRSQSSPVSQAQDLSRLGVREQDSLIPERGRTAQLSSRKLALAKPSCLLSFSFCRVPTWAKGFEKSWVRFRHFSR